MSRVMVALVHLVHRIRLKPIMEAIDLRTVISA
jgi:hypothetical protein